MAPTSTRWSNWLLFSLFVAGSLLFFHLVEPLLLPVVIGGFTATVFQGWNGWVRARMGGRERLAAVVACAGVVLAILLPLGLLVLLVTREAIGLLSYARLHLGQEGFAELWSGRLPERADRALRELLGWTGVGEAQLASGVTALRNWLVGMASGAFAFTSRSLVDAVLFGLTMYYTFADGRRWLDDALHLIPLEERHAREFCLAFRDVAGSVLFGTTVLALLHGLVGGFGYLLAGAPHPLVLAGLQICLACVPVVGTALLWVPLSLGLILWGRLAAGLALFGYMAVMSLVLEQFVRPQLLRGRMALHPFLLLLSVLGGVSALGFAGLLVGPLVVSLLTAVVRIYRRDFVGAPPAHA